MFAFFLSLSEHEPSITKGFQRGSYFDLSEFAHPLQSRLISPYESGVNSSGTLVEQEALVGLPELSASGMYLWVISFVARYRLPVMSRQEYSEWGDWQVHYDETLYVADGQPLISMALVSENSSLSVFSSSHGDAGLNIRLPEDNTSSDEEKLRDEEAEFVMLKYGHRLHPQGKWGRRRWRVWALMISRREGTFAAQRIGCIAISAQVWELGLPRLETVMLG